MRLISFICEDDSDLLPHFVNWYRSLGVDSFHFILQGKWSADGLSFFEGLTGVDFKTRTEEAFSGTLKRDEITKLARQFVGEWVVFADADEFLEIPTSSLSETVAILNASGINRLYATLLQRISADGSLPEIKPDSNLQTLFPHFSYGVCEDMGLPNPAWKSKYPLARIEEDFVYSRGHHLPKGSVAHLPIRAAVHHFKWRKQLLQAFNQSRGNGSNSHEMRVYQLYIQTHGRLPLSTVRKVSRQVLFEEGWLRIPTQEEWSLIEEMLEEKDEVMKRPIRIGFVTFELAGPQKTNGGIATSLSALAKLLAAHSFQVEIFYCPFSKDVTLPEIWFEYWAAHGVTLQFISRASEVNNQMRPHREVANLILKKVEASGHFDVLHFHDTQGYAAPFAAMKRAGLGFTNTEIVITAHGGTRWHNENNGTPWSGAAYNDELIAQRLCDVLVSPSCYMIDYLKSLDAIGKRQVHLFNLLEPESKSFQRPMEEPVFPRSLAFFGRLEKRKGIDLFVAVLKALSERGQIKPEIFFLGRFGNGFSKENLDSALDGLDFNFTFYHSLNSAQALALMKEKKCLVMIPSKLENSPCAVAEMIDNQMPFLASVTGGTAELIASEDQNRITLSNNSNEVAQKIENIFSEGFFPAKSNLSPLENELKHLKFWREVKESPTLFEDHRPVSFSVLQASQLGSVRLEKQGEIVALVPPNFDEREVNLLSLLAKLLNSCPQAMVAYPSFELFCDKTDFTVQSSLLEKKTGEEVGDLLRNEVPIVARTVFLEELKRTIGKSFAHLCIGDVLGKATNSPGLSVNLPSPVYRKNVDLSPEQYRGLSHNKPIITNILEKGIKDNLGRLEMPCGILSWDPLVTISSVPGSGSLTALGLFDSQLLKQKSLHFIHADFLGGHFDNLLSFIKTAQTRWPLAKFYFLAASEAEQMTLTRVGLPAVRGDLSIFVDDDFFSTKKEDYKNWSFDAIYRAPFNLLSNHFLASKIPVLALISQRQPDMRDCETTLRSHLVSAQYLNLQREKDIFFNPTDSQTRNWFLKAATGLGIRSTLDNRIAVTQQLLCGTPIVSIRTFLGCNDLLHDEFNVTVPAEPEAVAKGVEELKGRRLSRNEIYLFTKRTLKMLRSSFLAEVNQQISQHFGSPFQIDDISNLIGNVCKYRNAIEVFSPHKSQTFLFPDTPLIQRFIRMFQQSFNRYNQT